MKDLEVMVFHFFHALFILKCVKGTSLHNMWKSAHNSKNPRNKYPYFYQVLSNLFFFILLKYTGGKSISKNHFLLQLIVVKSVPALGFTVLGENLRNYFLPQML